MPWQLVYTSAPSGLVPGRSGFCTVARDRDMRERLAQELEHVSACESTALPEGQPLFTFRRIVIGLEAFGVVTRAGRAGIDYTQRANMLAHHLVFTAQEMAFLGDSITPAEVALLWPKWLERWEGAPRFFDISDKIQLQEIRTLRQRFPLPARTWQTISGDAGNAAFMVGNASVFFSGETLPCETILKLWAEGASLLPPVEIWRTQWATHWIPNDFSPRWAAHLQGKTRDETARVIDPVRPPALPAEIAALAAAARTGNLPESSKINPDAFPARPRSLAPLSAAIAPEAKRPWLTPALWLTFTLICAALLWIWLAPSRENSASLPPPPPNTNLPPLDLRPPAPAAPSLAKDAPPKVSDAPAQSAPAALAKATAPTPAPHFPLSAPVPSVQSPRSAWINSLPASPAFLLFNGWQTALVCDDFTQCYVSFAAPESLRTLMGETPPEVSLRPADSIQNEGEFLSFAIRPQEDYERGYSLVVRDSKRTAHIGFIWQLDFPDSTTARLTRRMLPANSPLLRTSPNAGETAATAAALQGNMAARLQNGGQTWLLFLITQPAQWRSFSLPIELAPGQNLLRDTRGKVAFAPEAADALDLIKLPPGFAFELADAQGLFREKTASARALILNRSGVYAGIEARIAQLRQKLSLLSSEQPDTAAERAPLEKEAARLADLKSRLAASDWPARLAPWTWRAIDKASGRPALELLKFTTPLSASHER